MFPTKILLATDGSGEAGRAARVAATLSGRLGCELHVAYVEPLPSALAGPKYTFHGAGYWAWVRERAARDADEKLGEEAEKIRGMGGEVAEAHARVGRPDAEIVRLAEGIGAGLVVVGSRGLSPLRRALLGSVSGSVVRHAHCPVLVVRGERLAEKGYPPGRVVLALDGSREAADAGRVAAEISNATGSELHLVYVSAAESPYYPGPEMPEIGEGYLERLHERARDWVDDQAERLKAEGVIVEAAHLRLGTPDREIVRLGEELGAGLIALGSRGLGGVRRALVGSVSDSVVRHAHCPVLVVRGQDRQRAAVAQTTEELGKAPS
jgi:nucleotide-binding universal stress UspA family protein